MWTQNTKASGLEAVVTVLFGIIDSKEVLNMVAIYRDKIWETLSKLCYVKLDKVSREDTNGWSHPRWIISALKHRVAEFVVVVGPSGAQNNGSGISPGGMDSDKRNAFVDGANIGEYTATSWLPSSKMISHFCLPAPIIWCRIWLHLVQCGTCDADLQKSARCQKAPLWSWPRCLIAWANFPLQQPSGGEQQRVFWSQEPFAKNPASLCDEPIKWLSDRKGNPEAADMQGKDDSLSLRHNSKVLTLTGESRGSISKWYGFAMEYLRSYAGGGNWTGVEKRKRAFQ